MFCKSYNDFFQVLANTTNQTIITELLKKPQNVSEIIKNTKLEQSKVSHSLKRLYECKIVQVKKDGKQRIYSLNKETIIPILSIVDRHAKKMCPTCIKTSEKLPDMIRARTI
jgi:DNA-binding transcriptional ArsR family regulator